MSRHTLNPADPILRHRWREQFSAAAEATFELTQADLPRLTAAAISLSQPVALSVIFDPKSDLLRLEYATQLTSPCGRCGEPVASAPRDQRLYRLYDTAEAADDALDLEGVEDPISSEDGLTLMSLVEDELLMGLIEPLRHAQCDLPETAHDPDGRADTHKPFAGLAQALAQAPKSASSPLVQKSRHPSDPNDV